MARYVQKVRCRYNETLTVPQIPATSKVASASARPGSTRRKARKSKTWERVSESSCKFSGRQEMKVARFAHTCLEGHYLAGEERFQVEWHSSDNSVWCVPCSRPLCSGIQRRPCVTILCSVFFRYLCRRVVKCAGLTGLCQSLLCACKRVRSSLCPR
jgi:hypothetical protein